MAKKSLTEHEILRDLARVQLLDYDPCEDDSYTEEDTMEKDERKPWPVPTREARDLILAEEIIRFASTVDRPCTSETHKITQIIESETLPDPFDTPDSEPFLCPRMAKKKRKKGANAVKKLKPKVTDKELTSAAGTSGSKPPQSASFRLSQPSASSFQDVYFPVEEAKIPIDLQLDPSSPASKPNLIPAATAIAQNELEQSSSSAPTTKQPTFCDNRLLAHILEKFQESDSVSPASLTESEYLVKLSALNRYLKAATELEAVIARNMKAIVTTMFKHKLNLQAAIKEVTAELALLQKHRDETSVEGDKDYLQENQQGEPKGESDEINISQQEGIPSGHADTVDNQPILENDNNVNNMEAAHATDDNDAGQSEFPEDDLSGLEWAEPEQERLGTVIRDLSLEMKTKELQQKKARCLRKGRFLAQSIEKKICDINKEIKAVNKKPLRQVVLPLDQIQDYDWIKVASLLNAKRTPEECCMYWKCCLHPAINGSDWGFIEAKAMEIIAQYYNFQNWDTIAEELGTGRTGYQCYLFYRKNLCRHSELRGTSNKK